MVLRAPILILIAITLISGLAHLLPENLWNALSFDREALIEGQYWRLLTAHFLHTNSPHLLLNVGALSLFWWLFSTYLQPIRTLVLVLCLSLLTSTMVFLFSPHLHHYVGLSGLVHGLIVWGAIKEIIRGKPFGTVLLLGVATKVIWEQLGGDTGGTAALINAKVAIDTHLWGATCGLFIAGLSSLSALPPLNQATRTNERQKLNVTQPGNTCKNPEH